MMHRDSVNGSKPYDIELSIVIVNFNTREMIVECLRSIEAQTRDTTYEIVIVDNMSTDGSADVIRCKFPNVRLLASATNLGFARANNLAISHARGRRILLLNPDTLILEQAIDRLMSFSREHPSNGIWGGRTLYGDGSLNPASCWRRLTVWNLMCSSLGLAFLAPNSSVLNSVAYGGWDRSTVRKVDIVTGCLLLIDRKLWNDLGGFDPAFFMYGEEADLCIRAVKAGAQPIITPNATIIHYMGASETSSVDKLIKLFRGKATIVNKHWSFLTRALGRSLLVLWPLIRLIVYGAAAYVTGRFDFEQTANKWRTIWKRRREWRGGYTLHSAPGWGCS
jgi:GT2 family glycosyltransferase